MVSLVALSSQGLRVAGLQILSSRRLDIYHRVVAPAWRMRWSEATVEVR